MYGVRAPALLALAAVCAAVVPAAAQQPEAAAPVQPPHRVQAPREKALPPVPRPEGEFWRWLRDSARRLRTLDGGPVAFAARYRISPQLARTIHDAAETQ